MKIKIEETVKDYIRSLPDKDRHVVGEYINRLTGHPHAQGDIKKLKTRFPQWRMHISSKYTLFYHVEDDIVCIDQIMTIERAHKKYGKI